MASKTMFGFRLDKVTLRHGMTRQGQDFRQAKLNGDDGETLLNSLESMRDHLVGVTRIGNLKYEPFGSEQDRLDPADSRPTIRVESMDITQSRIDFTVRIGRRGSHDLAIGASVEQDVVLEDLASTNPFLVSLYLPTTGSEAVLVSEVRSRMSAGYQLTKLLGVVSYENAFKNGHDDNGSWWRLVCNPVGDAERLGEVLTQGNGVAFQLERHNAAKGKPRSSDKVILRRNGLPAGKLSSVKAMVLGWAKLNVPDNYDAAPSGSPVEQLASLVGFEIEPSLFDDGSLSYEDAQGRQQTIRPNNVGDVFIYPVSIGERPTDTKLRSEAESRIRKLEASLRIPLNL
ncbi:hypothetical protein G7066_08705 [Leucobacter coleopterorum]|uniref:Uncharacterized protein n=1 Tax=Leucobacter coleopterorum TaxID=2714933 RepID=A0ABX6JWJ1_9MICO|nr:hypothetical protein [Leucobacter coleopterorum]QIM18670.1 hypothetical protein G7066_08705 [Leucobacter coleopterorum]